MLLQGIVFVLYLLNVSYGLSYDGLARDECFKKIYICGDHRVSITGGTNRLLTEPYRFGEVCRRHKEFIACIEEAVHFCAGNFSDLARMILDNRRSVKMFCTDLEWKKNYFQSAACINRREQEVKDKCRLEEDERVDDRPWWCLIPEPCEAIQRVFDCTVRKMEQRCGSIAAEVFRRFHLLKVENQDVVCEPRIRNPRYCRYATKAPTLKNEALMKEELIRRVGSRKYPTSDSMNNLITATIIDSVSLLKKIKLLSLKIQDSKEFLLKDLLGINYKLSKLLTDFYLPPESITPSYSEYFSDKTSTYETENSDELKTKFIKNTVYKLYELFNNNKDLILISEDRVELSLKDLKEFPVEHMSCFWLKSQNSFKCDIKVLPLEKADKMDKKYFDLWKHLSNASTALNVEKLLELVEFESSLSDDEEEFQPVSHFKEISPFVFVSIDDSIFVSNFNSSDIHRSGLHLDYPDKRLFEDDDDNGENGKMKTSADTISEKKELNIESSPLKQCDEHTDSLGKRNKKSFKYTFPVTHNLEQFSENQNEEFQLRKLEDALSKRFQNVNIVSGIKDSKSSDTVFSKKLNGDLSEVSNPSRCLENLYDAEHSKTNINTNMKTFNSNVEIKLNKDQILLELLNFVEE